jgi:hypothetical protein
MDEVEAESYAITPPWRTSGRLSFAAKVLQHSYSFDVPTLGVTFLRNRVFH